MYDSYKLRRLAVFMLIALILPAFSASAVFAERFFTGYDGLKWGSDIHTVMKVFRNGTLGRIGGQIVYTQMNPDKTVRQRTFGFSSNGLEAVSITFRASYVKRVGIDNILGELINNFGEGKLDRSSAPHLFSYFWEDPASRITLAYSGTSPDMAVLLFQHKK